MDYSCCVSVETKNGIIDASELGVQLGYTDGIILASDEGIKFVSTDGELLIFTLQVDDGYILGIDEERS